MWKGMKRGCAAVLALTLLAGITNAGAVLREDTGLEVTAVVDLDGRLRPAPPLVNAIEREVLPPFTRSVINVSGQQAGLYDYFAEADIGLQTLKVAGSLTNATAQNMVGDGLSILGVTAQIRDVLTLASALPGKQVVTLSLAIDGSLTFDPSPPIAPVANASLFFGPAGGVLNSDLGSYRSSGAIADTLQVAIEIEGPSTTVLIDAALGFNIFFVRPGETVTGSLDNTAVLTLTLPAGVTLAGSNSGTFGEVIAPIPLPAAGWLFVPACAALMVRARRRCAG
jgi:hypothetical protein